MSDSLKLQKLNLSVVYHILGNCFWSCRLSLSCCFILVTVSFEVIVACCFVDKLVFRFLYQVGYLYQARRHLGVGVAEAMSHNLSLVPPPPRRFIFVTSSPYTECTVYTAVLLALLQPGNQTSRLILWRSNFSQMQSFVLIGYVRFTSLRFLMLWHQKFDS